MSSFLNENSGGGGSGSPQTFQQTLDVGSTLDKDNVIDVDGNELNIKNGKTSIISSLDVLGSGTKFTGIVKDDITDNDKIWSLGIDETLGLISVAISDIVNNKSTAMSVSETSVVMNYENAPANNRDATTVKVDEYGVTSRANGSSSFIASWLRYNTISEVADQIMKLNNDGSLELNSYGGGGVSGIPAFLLAVNGSGKVIEVRQDISGTATLVGGTVTVATSAVQTGDIIQLTFNRFLSAPTGSIVDGTEFVINSTSATDDSTVNWWIVPNV